MAHPKTPKPRVTHELHYCQAGPGGQWQATYFEITHHGEHATSRPLIVHTGHDSKTALDKVRHDLKAAGHKIPKAAKLCNAQELRKAHPPMSGRTIEDLIQVARIHGIATEAETAAWKKAHAARKKPADKEAFLKTIRDDMGRLGVRFA